MIIIPVRGDHGNIPDRQSLSDSSGGDEESSRCMSLNFFIL